MNFSHSLKHHPPGALTLVLVLLLSPLAGRAAEPVLGPKKEDDVKKLNQLVQDLDKNKFAVAGWLRTTIGFSPELDGFPLDVHAYFGLPDAVKLQTAYAACENTKADSGTVLLKLLDKRLALELLQKKGDLKDADRAAGRKLAEEILALHKELNPAFKLNDLQGQIVKFAFKPAPPRPELTEQQRQRIAVLAQYLQQARNDGPVDALKQYFGLTADAAYLLLWESGKVPLAFERALAQQDEKMREKFLETVITRANEDALKRKDRTLARTAVLWATPTKPDVADDLLPPPTEQRSAKIPDAPKAVFTLAKRTEIYNDDNKKAASLKPAEVRKRADNPTGIFFAGEARAEEGLPKPTKVQYSPGDQRRKGKLTVTFADKTAKMLAPVTAEEAWLAYEMTYGKDAAKPGDGVPLLVLDGANSYFEVKDGKLLTGNRREVIVHPALIGSELGLACARIDGMPRTRQWLLEEIDADPVWNSQDKDQAARRRQVLNQTADWVFDPWTNLSRKYGRHSSVFRVTDVPLLIRGGDGVLLVERDDPDGRWSEPLRRGTFIEADVVIQRYSQNGRPTGEVKRPEYYRAEAYQLMAELVPVSAELQRLNNFAAVLGVVRWAKSQGAEFAAPAKPKDGPYTPEAVAIFQEKIIPLPGASKEEALKLETGKLDAAMKKLGEDEKVKKFEEECEKVVNADDDETRDKAAKAADQLARESPEVQLLEELVEAKYSEILLIDRRMQAKDSTKPDLKAEEERLEALAKQLEKRKKVSPAEYLIGNNLIIEYAKRLKEQTTVD